MASKAEALNSSVHQIEVTLSNQGHTRVIAFTFCIKYIFRRGNPYVLALCI